MRKQDVTESFPCQAVRLIPELTSKEALENGVLFVSDYLLVKGAGLSNSETIFLPIKL